MWVMAALALLYFLLIRELRNRQLRAFGGMSKQQREANVNTGLSKDMSRMQRSVLLQSFLICFIVFCGLASYAASNFFDIPPRLAKYATIAVQTSSGCTSIILLAFNSTIRNGVKRLVFGRWMAVGGVATASKGLTKCASQSQKIESQTDDERLGGHLRERTVVNAWSG